MFPARLTTREPRIDDDPSENRPVGNDEFDRLVERGNLCLWWSKPDLGNVRYGFLADSWHRRVLGANQELLAHDFENVFAPNAKPAEDFLIVNVAASEDVRAQRIVDRNPKMPAQELEYRISVDGSPPNWAHLVVHTDRGYTPEQLATALGDFIDNEAGR